MGPCFREEGGEAQHTRNPPPRPSVVVVRAGIEVERPGQGAIRHASRHASSSSAPRPRADPGPRRLSGDFAFVAPAQAQAEIAFTDSAAPPPLPAYSQSTLPGPGFLWIPGYWAMSGDGVVLDARLLGAPACRRPLVDARVLGLERERPRLRLSIGILGSEGRLLRRRSTTASAIPARATTAASGATIGSSTTGPSTISKAPGSPMRSISLSRPNPAASPSMAGAGERRSGRPRSKSLSRMGATLRRPRSRCSIFRRRGGRPSCASIRTTGFRRSRRPSGPAPSTAPMSPPQRLPEPSRRMLTP